MSHSRRTFVLVSLSGALSTLALPGLADPAARGLQLAKEAYERTRGFGDYRTRMVMILRDRRGSETRRELEAFTLEGDAGEQKSLIYFRSPRDIRGTALLTHSYPTKDDEQWLYLPALKRTKRISVSGRSSPFMGSEFAYEDLVTTHYSQYGYRFFGEDELRDVPCNVIERYPRYEGSGYERQRVWLDQKEYRPMRIEFWDRKSRHLKTLDLGGYRQYLEKFWQPSQARMNNHLTRESTLLTWDDYEFRTGLTESDFNRNALDRAR